MAMEFTGKSILLETARELTKTTSPPLPLPRKIPGLGRLYADKTCLNVTAQQDIPTKEILFMPQKIDIAKINKLYCNNDQPNVVDKRPNQQNKPTAPKVVRELFKPARCSVYKGYIANPTSRTRVLNRKSSARTKIKMMTDTSLLDSSLVERKLFKSEKTTGTFKFKSPSVIQKIPSINIVKCKSPVKLTKNSSLQGILKSKELVKLQEDYVTACNSEEEFLELEDQCEVDQTELVSTYITKVNNLIEVDKKEFETYVTNSNKLIEGFKKAHDDRINQMKDALQTLTSMSIGENKQKTINTGRNNKSLMTTTISIKIDEMKENVTPKQVSTVKKFVKFSANHRSSDKVVNDALALYNSCRNDCSGILLTPKINNFSKIDSSPTPKSARKFISRKIQQQCLLLQDTPVRK